MLQTCPVSEAFPFKIHGEVAEFLDDEDDDEVDDDDDEETGTGCEVGLRT